MGAAATIAARAPYAPNAEEWRALYEMLCGHCAVQGRCDVLEAMIEMKAGGAWPDGGWVSDPGAEVTCLSYQPAARPPAARAERRRILKARENDLPAICGGCAARKGSEASVALHTQRDYSAAVKAEATFLCHETGKPCGGWCRAVRQRRRR